MALTYTELPLISELYHRNLEEPIKKKAVEFFDRLDNNHDGKIRIRELIGSTLANRFGQDFLQHLFYSLDEENKGYLDFRQCLAVYFLCNYSTRICEACELHIPYGLGYTCFRCWEERLSSIDGQTFTVCLGCHSTHNYGHSHNAVHLAHDFVLFDKLLSGQHLPSSSEGVRRVHYREVEQTMKQCTVCGDHHECTAQGFTCNKHMTQMYRSKKFVCEWCFSYLCSRCGKFFCDATTRAEPGKWLQRMVCPSCYEKNVTNTSYDSRVKELKKSLALDKLMERCTTCNIKQKNGTLYWVINGKNMAEIPR
ncbi:hypothetical protein KP509_25G012700 [Ceratopteris richardii]|uniref:Uncharacterized protein n=1 Tax=Ceratopteris richardii TaxID=49495 RepID=A0A8T2RMR3_CERRI|nr:hypothetical protein KP509_25G012700 [Ceratopteris richardii]